MIQHLVILVLIVQSLTESPIYSFIENYTSLIPRPTLDSRVELHITNSRVQRIIAEIIVYLEMDGQQHVVFERIDRVELRVIENDNGVKNIYEINSLIMVVNGARIMCRGSIVREFNQDNEMIAENNLLLCDYYTEQQVFRRRNTIGSCMDEPEPDPPMDRRHSIRR